MTSFQDLKRSQLSDKHPEDDVVRAAYADIMTFVLCLFAVLLSLNIHKENQESFFTKMRVKFGGKVVLQNKQVTSEDLFISRLQGYISEERLAGHAQVKVDEQKIKLILEQPVLFASGYSDLKPTSKKILDDLTVILSDVDNPIIVEGHTDNVPIHNHRYDSNWVLSFDRAYMVVKYFINTKKIVPKQLSAIGYGEFHPVSANASEAAREKNRRIEINIVRVKESEMKKYQKE